MSVLGDFLRERRAAVTAAEAGFPPGGDRRVPGLRREEVAVLARISPEYYLRLEQGRETNPSLLVVESLSEALRLTPDARHHLLHLAGLTPGPGIPDAVEVEPGMRSLLEAMPTTPAFVLSRAYDVLAMNPLGDALFDVFPEPRNMLLDLFLRPEAVELYRDWDEVTVNLVGALRFQAGAAPGDRRIREVVELASAHPRFRDLWGAADVHEVRHRRKRLRHRLVGDVDVLTRSFEIPGFPGQLLSIYHAPLGTGSAAALDALARTLAGRRRDPVPV